MKIILVFIIAIIVFFGFAFFNLTFDISKWSEDGRFVYVIITFAIIFVGCMMEYLNPKSKN